MEFDDLLLVLLVSAGGFVFFGMFGFGIGSICFGNLLKAIGLGFVMASVGAAVTYLTCLKPWEK